MKINGILSTLARKGNENEIGRKLEPEARSAGEYSHYQKALFAEKMMPISWAREHRIHISGFGFNNHGRDGR